MLGTIRNFLLLLDRFKIGDDESWHLPSDEKFSFDLKEMISHLDELGEVMETFLCIHSDGRMFQTNIPPLDSDCKSLEAGTQVIIKMDEKGFHFVKPNGDWKRADYLTGER